MKRRTLAALVLFVLGACGPAETPRPAGLPSSAPPVTPAPVHEGRSIDLTAMDRSVKPGADFFMYANGSWYAKAQIAPERATNGLDRHLADEIEVREKAIMEEAAAAAKNDPKSPLAKIGDYYASLLDEPAIEAKGTKPLQPALDKIAKIADARSLATFLGSDLRADVDALNLGNFETDRLFGLWVEQDIDDPSRCVGYLLQGGLGMPDRTYYLDDAPAMAKHREAYVKHLTKLIRLANVATTDKDAEAKARRVFALELRIADVHAPLVESNDIVKAHNPWSKDDFAKRAPGLDWTAFFAGAGLDKEKTIVVWHPGATAGIAALVKSEPLATWKEYLTVRAIDRMGNYLPKAFVDETFAFRRAEFRGIETQKPRWKRAIDATDEAMGEAVGKAYVERHFPPASKRAVEEMAARLVASFGKRIDSLAWMSPATKARAKGKLATLKIAVGYPDRWRDDSELVVTRGDAFGNWERAELFMYRRALARLGKAPDRDDWVMFPHVVDAINLPLRNALHMPAGILVSPYFDARATDAANYGGVGAVIGHEITHSFDNTGSKFDERGRYANWWTPDDLAHFDASAQALVAQFDAYKPLPDVSVNGLQTLGENIADVAGLAIAYDAWQASLGGKPAPTENGLTGDQQFFLAFAQTYQEKARDEYTRERLAADVHAPPPQRALTVRNLDPWYAAFDVKPGEPLFLAPQDRVRVW